MKRRFRVAALVAFLVAGIVIQLPGRAAIPATGILDSSNSTAPWSGSFLASVPTLTPVGCAGPADPSCDHFFLTVDLPHNTLINVAVSTPPSANEDIQPNDVDLYVYAPDGLTALASSAAPHGQETLTFNHNAIAYGTGPYEIRVQPWLVEPNTPYDGVARVGDEIDVEGQDCLQVPPVPAPPLAPPDTADPIKLSVTVLLDGPSVAEGQAVMNRAAESYAPLGINLVSTYRTDGSFSGSTEGQDKIDEAKAHFGGKRPRTTTRWADIVYVLTDTNITIDGDTGLAGLADCIGGVRFDNHAFAVGESSAVLGGAFTLSQARLFADLAAEVAAHEIGHLMSAHHHNANCVEGLPPFPAGETPTELDPCTLMFNVVDFTSLNFSTVNQFYVRGEAETFARP